jgi:hypothetical protein
MKFQIHLFVFCLVFVVVGGTGCLADGFYIPSTQAYETLPDIPQQRAFLEFHNGTETLVVESSLDSEEGQRFAWILPLPSPPESIEAVDPGGLSSLQFLTAPRIVTQSEAKIYRPVLALIVSLLITISLVTLNPDVRRQCRDVFISLCFIVFLLMISVGGPFLGDSKSPKSPAEAVSIERIGNYEVAVLSGKDSRAIDDWLRANEYAPLPERAGLDFPFIKTSQK